MFKEFLQYLFQRYKQSQQWLERHRRWRRLFVGLLLLSLAVAFGLGLQQQWQQLDDYALAMRWQWLALAALLYFFSMVLQMLIWHEMVAKLAGYDSLRENLIVYNIVNLAKSMPGIAFHVAGRLMLYEQRNVAIRPIIKAIAFEAGLHPFIGLLCLAIVALVRTTLPMALILLAIIVLGVITVTTIGWVANYQKVRTIEIGKWGVVAWFTWLNGLFFLWAILRAAPIPLTLSMLDIWYLWLVGSMISYLGTYLLGGVSILRELTLTGLLQAYIPLPLAVVVVVWSRLIGLVSEVGWSALLLMILRGWRFFATLAFTKQKE